MPTQSMRTIHTLPLMILSTIPFRVHNYNISHLKHSIVPRRRPPISIHLHSNRQSRTIRSRVRGTTFSLQRQTSNTSRRLITTQPNYLTYLLHKSQRFVPFINRYTVSVRGRRFTKRYRPSHTFSEHFQYADMKLQTILRSTHPNPTQPNSTRPHPHATRSLRTPYPKQISKRNLRPIHRRVITRVINRRLHSQQVRHVPHRTPMPTIRHRRYRRTISRRRRRRRNNRQVPCLPQGRISRLRRMQRRRLSPNGSRGPPRRRMLTKNTATCQRPFTHMVPNLSARHSLRRPTKTMLRRTTSRDTKRRSRRPIQTPRPIRRGHRRSNTRPMSQQRQPPRRTDTVLVFTMMVPIVCHLSRRPSRTTSSRGPRRIRRVRQSVTLTTRITTSRTLNRHHLMFITLVRTLRHTLRPPFLRRDQIGNCNRHSRCSRLSKQRRRVHTRPIRYRQRRSLNRHRRRSSVQPPNKVPPSITSRRRTRRNRTYHINAKSRHLNTYRSRYRIRRISNRATIRGLVRQVSHRRRSSKRDSSTLRRRRRTMSTNSRQRPPIHNVLTKITFHFLFSINRCHLINRYISIHNRLLPITALANHIENRMSTLQQTFTNIHNISNARRLPVTYRMRTRNRTRHSRPRRIDNRRQRSRRRSRPTSHPFRPQAKLRILRNRVCNRHNSSHHRSNMRSSRHHITTITTRHNRNLDQHPNNLKHAKGRTRMQRHRRSNRTSQVRNANTRSRAFQHSFKR